MIDIIIPQRIGLLAFLKLCVVVAKHNMTNLDQISLDSDVWLHRAAHEDHVEWPVKIRLGDQREFDDSQLKAIVNDDQVLSLSKLMAWEACRNIPQGGVIYGDNPVIQAMTVLGLRIIKLFEDLTAVEAKVVADSEAEARRKRQAEAESVTITLIER